MEKVQTVMGFVVKHTLTHPSGRVSYRRVFPPELRGFVPGREHKVSLGRPTETGFLSRYEAASAAYDAIVTRARREMVGDYDQLTAGRIRDIVDAYVSAEVEADTVRRWDAGAKGRAAQVGDMMEEAGLAVPPAPKDPAGRWIRGVTTAASVLVEAGRALRAAGDLDGIVVAWRDVGLTQAEKYGLLLNPAGPAFGELCIALNDGAIAAHEIMLRRATGEHVPTPPRPEPREPAARLAKAPEKPRTKLPVLATFDAYAKAQGMTAGVKADWRRNMEKLVAFVGHDDAARLTTDDLLAWRDHLAETPSKRGGKLDPVTIKGKYIGAAKAMLGWAVQERKLRENVASPVVVRVPKKAKLRERDFTADEAQAILKASLVPAPPRTSERFARARRWIPWLCAYTGARVNELSQLRREDVQKVEGHWFIRITPEAGTVKTKEARWAPLHEHLVEQGFLAVVKAAADGPLFYDPLSVRRPGEGNRHYKKVGEKIAEWVRKDVGVDDPNIMPNHAWRHAFKTRALAADMAERVVDAIQGHAQASQGRKYGSVQPAAMVREMAKMPRFEVK